MLKALFLSKMKRKLKSSPIKDLFYIKQKKNPKLKASHKEIVEAIVNIIQEQLSPQEITEMFVGIAMAEWGAEKVSKNELEFYIHGLVEKAFSLCHGIEKKRLIEKTTPTLPKKRKPKI